MMDNGWAALVRKLRATLTDEEWASFVLFLVSIKGRYDGEDFSKLTLTELDTLSTWASRAQQ